MDQDALMELADSIKAQGIIQPIIARRLGGKYEIIAGERRWRAAKIAKLTEVPVIVKEIDNHTVLAFSLIENIQREDLNPIEEAVAFARFSEEFSMTHLDIAKMIGRSRAAVSNAIRLLSLSDSVKVLLKERMLDMGHARALLTLELEEQQLLAERIIEKTLTVRETEKLARTMKLPRTRKKKSVVNDDRSRCWANELTKKLSSKVTINLNNSGSGTVVIHVDSPDEIDWFVKHIRVD